MKEKLKIIGNLVLNKTLYRGVFLALGILVAVPYIQTILGPYFKILLGWGLVILLVDIFRERQRLLRHKMMWCLLALPVFYLLTLVTHLTTQWYNERTFNSCLYMFVFFFVLFKIDGRDRKKIKREMTIMASVLIILTSFLTFICLVTFFFGINTSYEANTAVVYTGMYENRLWGLYNPNIGAVLALISAVFSGFMMVTVFQKRIQVLCALNIIMEYLMIILAGSRTVQYGAVIGVMLLVFGLVPVVTKKWVGFHLRNLCVRSVIALLIGAVLLGSYKIATPVAEHLPRLAGEVVLAAQESQRTDSAIQENQVDEPVLLAAKKQAQETETRTSLDRTDLAEGAVGGFLNGRQYIWAATIKVWKTSPILGVTSSRIYPEGRDFVKNKSFRRAFRTGVAHNIYLQVLAASGLAGFIPFMIFVFLLIYKIIRKICTIKNLRGNQWFIATAFVTFFYLMTELTESRILYTVNVHMVIFWIMAGYCLRLSYLRVPGVLTDSEQEKVAFEANGIERG